VKVDLCDTLVSCVEVDLRDVVVCGEVDLEGS
jgi:hypothetical protein